MSDFDDFFDNLAGSVDDIGAKIDYHFPQHNIPEDLLLKYEDEIIGFLKEKYPEEFVQDIK